MFQPSLTTQNPSALSRCVVCVCISCQIYRPLHLNVSKSCPSSVCSDGSLLVCAALTSRVSPRPFRSGPCLPSRPREALYPPLMPHSPARRSLACVQTCPAVRNHRLPCRQPAREPWLRLRCPLRSPSTDIRAGPQTRKAALKETRLCSGSASCLMTPPSGMWRKFMTSSDHCQVRPGRSLLHVTEGKLKNGCCWLRNRYIQSVLKARSLFFTHKSCAPNWFTSVFRCCLHRLSRDSGRVSVPGD